VTSAPEDFASRWLADHDLLLAALETPAFWAEVLDGALGGAEPEAVHVEPVGTGQVASCLRVRMAHDIEGAPKSVVAKVASADPVSRATSAALRHGEIETGFYSRFAPDCAVRTPQCHLAAVNEAGDDFILVLQDMADSTQADQIHGMDPDAAAAALDQLAALHATWWEAPPPHTGEVLGEQGDPNAHAALLGMLFPGFSERYAERIGPQVMEVAENLVERASDYLGNREGPVALVHRDFRPDNLLVDDDGVTVVDWQTVNAGAALADLSYFLGGALVTEQRVAHEREMLDRYRAALLVHGVQVDAQTVERGHRRYALDGLVMAIGASQVVGQTDRGDAMFCAMAERSARHALEAHTFELF